MKFYAMQSHYGKVGGGIGKKLHVFYNKREKNEWLEQGDFESGSYNRFPADAYLIYDYRQERADCQYIEHKGGNVYLVDRRSIEEFEQLLDPKTLQPVGDYVPRKGGSKSVIKP